MAEHDKENGLPEGVATADKVKDKTKPSNTLMVRWAESAAKTGD